MAAGPPSTTSLKARKLSRSSNVKRPSVATFKNIVVILVEWPLTVRRPHIEAVEHGRDHAVKAGDGYQVDRDVEAELLDQAPVCCGTEHLAGKQLTDGIVDQGFVGLHKC